MIAWIRHNKWWWVPLAVAVILAVGSSVLLDATAERSRLVDALTLSEEVEAKREDRITELREDNAELQAELVALREQVQRLADEVARLGGDPDVIVIPRRQAPTISGGSSNAPRHSSPPGTVQTDSGPPGKPDEPGKPDDPGPRFGVGAFHILGPLNLPLRLV